ncbi:MAG: hypothetical protein SH818_01530 [Saprospiraceae bacterium]|nr:hypothetical protein [Saprospiraceae bacterium]
MNAKILGLILMGFTAVTAILSGIVLFFYPDGHFFQMSVNLLEHSFFDNFLIPGLVLALVVGGSNLVGALSLAFDYKWSDRTTFFAGLCICGWIVVQYLLIRTFDWLQVFYLSLGLVLILMAFLHKIQPGSEQLI